MHVFAFESYGVRIRIESNRRRVLDRARRIAEVSLVGNVTEIDPATAEHLFVLNKHRDQYALIINGGRESESPHARAIHSYFESLMRVHVAENAKNLVFIHAAVAWKGKAVLFPADSYQGKTTLVAELVKRGAVYYSDDFAILDKDGLLHPFPRRLSIRDPNGSGSRSNVSATRLGGLVGHDPLPISMVILTRFKENATWRPKKLTAGTGIMKILPKAIPLRTNAKQTLKVLQTVANRAIIAKSFRGDTKLCLDDIISFIERT